MKTQTGNDVILDSINEGVFTVDLNWRISSFNRAAERITGISRDDAIGSTCSDVFHANICEKECVLRRTLDTGQPVVNVMAHIITNKGIRLPIRISTAVLKNKKGEVIGGVETFQDLTQLEALKKELKNRQSFEDIAGRSPVMLRLFDILPQIAESSSTVLIEGASGTGKELFARAIHNLSPRKKKKFVPINCAALPDALLESELFGYKAGAFTDAKKDKPGRFVLADGGTIFLDEIGDISPAMQVRLLRVLQERIVEPLGSSKPVPINVRVVAATNKNLKKLVASGEFREDLYYRIRVVHLQLPELKQRKEDIPLLAERILEKLNRLQSKNIEGISPDVMAVLMSHDYPGNVRELENIIEQAFVLCRGGTIEVHHLPAELRPEIKSPASSFGVLTIQSMEKRLIAETLLRFNGNRRKAAKELGIDASTLFRKIKSLGIEAPETDGRYKKK
ncbi:MAG: Fis family transcriptional regulator [Lentisphaerae bacterium GWF2_45_14]|nr:MAG: Fis family transcriptional regulator [Lentisphaerae bacterium GWF2_45_14]